MVQIREAEETGQRNLAWITDSILDLKIYFAIKNNTEIIGKICIRPMSWIVVLCWCWIHGLIVVLWGYKRVSLFLENTHWSIYGKRRVQFTLKWLRETNNIECVCVCACKSMPIDLPICLPIHQSVKMVVNVTLEKLVKEYTEILFTFLGSFVSNPNAFFSKKKRKER